MLFLCAAFFPKQVLTKHTCVTKSISYTPATCMEVCFIWFTSYLTASDQAVSNWFHTLNFCKLMLGVLCPWPILVFVVCNSSSIISSYILSFTLMPILSSYCSIYQSGTEERFSCLWKVIQLSHRCQRLDGQCKLKLNLPKPEFIVLGWKRKCEGLQK